MKQKISALMDGELFEEEAEDLLAQFKQIPGAHRDWAVYHLIGDVLRQPEHIHSDLSAKVSERMREEPVVLVPRRRVVRQKLREAVLSVAATLAAVGVVSWMSLQIRPEVAPKLAMQQPSLRLVKMQINPKANDYLMAHQEFSPSIEMNGGISYIRTVSYGTEEK